MNQTEIELANVNLARALKHIRTYNRAEQTEVAIATRCTAQTVSGYERGKCSPDSYYLFLFADHFETKVANIFNFASKLKTSMTDKQKLSAYYESFIREAY